MQILKKPTQFALLQPTVFLIFGLLFLLVAQSLAITVETIENTANRIRCNIVFDSINVIEKKVENTWYSEISFSDCAYTDIEGLPRLPVTALSLGIPLQGTPTLRIVQEQTDTREVRNPELVTRPDAETSVFDETRIIPTALYPETSTMLGVEGFFREQRLLQVELHPVRYQENAGLLHITRSMTIEITFSSSGKKNDLAVTQASLGNDEKIENLYKQILSNYDTSRKWRGRIVNNSTLNKTTAINAPYRFKLGVEQDGVYAITGQELADAGADLNTIAVSTLTMYNRGQVVPISVEGDADGEFDAEDRIFFIGEHNHGDDTYLSLFSETNVYWLTWGSGNGARFAQVTGASGSNSTDTLNTSLVSIHLEKDLLYDRLVSMPLQDEDHWLWQLMEDGQEYDIEIPGPGMPEAGPVRIQAAFQGLTHTSVSPDHHILIKFNHEIIDEVIWDNQEPYVFDSGELFLGGNDAGNTVSFNLPGDLEGVLLDRIYLNWVNIEFKQKLKATNDSLVFMNRSQTSDIFRIDGFTGPDLFLFTNTGTRITDIKSRRIDDTYSFYFSDNNATPKTFYAATEEGLKSVVSITEATESGLLSRSNGADYIIISHADFMEQAQELAAHRTANGMRSKVVDIQHVFDDFSDGLHDPRAIKKFLQYAYQNWQKPSPLYVLLLGDTTHKLDKQIARDENLPSFVPTFMEYTQTWGMSSSDNYLASIIGDDDLPDLFLGRLPVNSPEQAEIMISKTIAHEAEYTPAEWRRHLLLLTGVEPYFEASARHLYKQYIPGYMVTDWVATIDTSRHFGSTEDVANYINSGQSILNFVGHGGGGVFSDAELFQIEDIERLANHNKYPFVFSLTCFIGHFDNPDSPSLAEELLAAQDKGIVGSFGSSGRAFLQGDFYLNNAIFTALFEQNVRTYGQVSTLGKLEMIKQTQGFWDHVKSYNLLGDPALTLYIPDNTANVQLSTNTLLDNQDLVVSGSVPGYSSGNVTLSVHNDFDSLLTESTISMQNGAFNSTVLNLNANVRKAWGDNGGNGRVRAYFNNNSNEAAGYTTFSVGRPYVSALYTFPEQPLHNQSFFIVANINRADLTATLGQVDSMMVRWSNDSENWNYLGMIEQSSGYWKIDTTLTFAEGTMLYYDVYARTGLQIQQISETKEIQVAYRPDLYADSESFRVYGDQQTFVYVTIKNRGIQDCGPFSVNLYERTDTSSVAIGDTLNVAGLDGKGETEVAFLWNSPTSGRHTLVCIVDEAEVVPESDERNNRVTSVTGVVSRTSGTQGELYDDSRRYYIKIPSNGLTKTSSVKFVMNDDETMLTSATQAGLAPVNAPGDTVWSAMQISFADTTIQLQQAMETAVYYDSQDSLTAYYLALNALKIYFWNPATQTWKGVESTIKTQENVVVGELPQGYTIFSLMGSGDGEAPSIQVGVEGQNFADGDVVGRNPVFTISVQDSSGFDVGTIPVTLSLDNQAVEDDKVTLYQNPDQKRQVTATFIPDLTAGDHTLQVEATDLNGNSNTIQIQFSVASEFGLESIANHPNPFVDETVIAFTLADIADEVKLDIYTVSGRLIRSFEFVDISGYVEHDWDGLDEEGREVANGVYYLRIRAKQGEKSIEQIEKMAKLK